MLYRPLDSPWIGQWCSLLEVSVLMRDPALRTAVIDMTRVEAVRNVQDGQVPWDVLTETIGLLSFNTFDLWLVTWAMMGVPVGVLIFVGGWLMAVAGWIAWRLSREVT
jgi:hypothetical protein